MLSQKVSRSSSIAISLSALIGLNAFAISAIAADTTTNTATQAPEQTAASTNASASTMNNAAASASTSTAASTPDANANATAAANSEVKPVTKTKWRPGEELSISTNTEDLVPTDDAEIAKKQVDAYPDSPEAAFIYAVALTRTSKVEDALKEVRRARKLAEQKGGNAYFDKMITTYEDMLKTYPNENRVRYGLAWAYYMKAYLVANYSRKVAAWKAVNGDPLEALKKQQAAAAAGTPATPTTSTAKTADTTAGAGNTAAQIAAATGASPADLAKAQAAIKTAVQPGKGLDLNAVMGAVGSLATGNTANLPKIPSVMDKVDPADIPQIKSYYEKALGKLDELIAQKPDDVWALVYRAHLKAEYNGNLDEAMTTWMSCREKFPNNPAAYFFLGEGYLKQGNLKESLNNVSKAVALRSMGF
jgi:tetratricopeptide (TPR) repeat protein